MDTVSQPKLLDVIQFPASLQAGGLSGLAEGTIVEDFATAYLVEVADEQGVPTEFVTVPADAAKIVWSAPDRTADSPAAVDAKTRFEAGLLLIQNGSFRDARDELRAAFELDPSLAGTLMNMANEPAKAGKYDLAIALYQTIVELQPQNRLNQHNLAAALINRGIVFSRQGAFERAIEDFEASLWAVPADAEIVEKAQHNLAAAYTELGVQLGQIKRYRESCGVLLKALELKPSDVTRRNLAIALVSLKTSAGTNPEMPSPDNFRRALQMGLTFSECLNVYGATLMGLGDSEKAVRVLEAAVRLDPHNQLAQGNLASIRSHQAGAEIPAMSIGLAPLDLLAAAA
jgi:tetratricopeptide (TPR) repeat protein